MCMGDPLALIHLNIYRFIPYPLLEGTKYFVTFIYYYSHKAWAYLIKHKKASCIMCMGEPLALAHLDMQSFIPYPFFGGTKYFVTFIDYSHKVWAYPIKHKVDV